MTNEYQSPHGMTFRFNDHVCMEATLGVPIEKRTGRLVQVRKGRGAFGSDIYFIRLRDESLMAWENVYMRHVGDARFEDAWYRSNGITPPEIPDQPVLDEPDITYTSVGGFPETGFVIENPKQPESEKQMFGMIVTKESVTIQI